MFTIAYIFFGFGSFLSLETIKPKIIPENSIMSHTDMAMVGSLNV